MWRRNNLHWAWHLGALVLVVTAVLLWFRCPSLESEVPTRRGQENRWIEPASTPKEAAQKTVDVDEDGHTSEKLWQAVPESSVPPADLPTFTEKVTERALVRILNVTDGWRVGDRIVLEIPQLERNLDSIIEEVRPGPGIRSYVGTLVDERDGRFVVTVGTKSTLATIITSKGAFEMVAQGELGWLMPAANMNRDRDYSQPDYYLPGDSRFDPSTP